MLWVTTKIAADLSQIAGVKSTKVVGPGGDYDTQAVVVGVIGSSARFWIRGYPKNLEDCIENVTNVEVEYIEVTDGEDSRGGLNSSNKDAAKVYVGLRQYFLQLGGDVINHHDEIF